MRKIFILDAHPRANSLIAAMAKAYTEGAKAAGAQVELTALRDLNFDALKDPMSTDAIEKDLLETQNKITEAQHFVFLFPTWWTSVPAQAKGFIDRTFKSGWAFQYQKGFPKGLLAGRSARIIHTCGAPAWANKWIYGEPEVRMMRTGVLKFCGFSPVHVSKFGGVMDDKAQVAEQAIKDCLALGKSDAAR